MSKKKQNTEAYQFLLKCINLNKENDFRSSISDIENINERDDEGATLLWRAVSSGNIGIVRILLDYCADLEIPDKSGFPAFHLAMQNGDVLMAQELFERGVNLHSRDGKGNNALVRALFCSNGMEHHLIPFLLRKGVNPNASGHYGGITAADCANTIANYDYKPWFADTPNSVKLTDRIKYYENKFNDFAITSLAVINGADVQFIRYYELDKIWEFQATSSPNSHEIRVVKTEAILDSHPDLLDVMKQMSVDQYATFLTQRWEIKDIKPQETA